MRTFVSTHAPSVLAPLPAVLAPLPAVLALLLATAPAPAAGQAPTDTLTLEAVARAALETHPLTGVARAGVDAARGSRRSAASDRLPALALSGSAVRFEEPMVVAPLHGFDPAAPPEFDRTLIQSRLTVGYTLFDGGARSARIRRADAGVEAARASLRVREMELLADVVAAYVEVRTLRDVVASHRERILALEAEADRVRRFLEEGTAPRVELLRVRATLGDAEAEARGAEARLGAAERDLERVAGLARGSVARRTLPAIRLEPEALAVADVPDADLPVGADAPDARAPTSNPALEEARHRLAAAGAAREEEAARYWPDFDVDVGLQQFGSAAGDVTTEWQTGLRISYPLFTGGARAGAVDRARAEERLAAEELRLRSYHIDAATDVARAAWVEASSRARALTASVEQHEEVARIEALALAEGAGVQSDFLRAQAALLRARAGLAEARGRAALAAARWARARGTLTLDWLLRHLETER